MKQGIRMNPDVITKEWKRIRTGQIFEAGEAFESIKRSDTAQKPDSLYWAITVVAAYRAGRLSMFQDCRKRYAIRRAGKGMRNGG